MITKTCTKCSEDKPISAFRYRNKEKNIRQSWCAACFTVHERERYRNDDKMRDRKVSNSRRRIQEKRQHVWDYLKDNPCTCCGETDPVVLQFDHLLRASKYASVSDMVGRDTSLKRLQEEIDKCRVLCANCHARHTAKQLGYYTHICR